MITQEDMEKDLFSLLSKLIIEKDDDTPSRLKAQKEALKELKCSKPALGRWIERCDYPFLIETLSLDDATFAGEFPGILLPAASRSKFIEELRAHLEDEPCRRCFLKASYDLEWQARVEKVLFENKALVAKAIGHGAGKR